jgi:hypothetical protein
MYHVVFSASHLVHDMTLEVTFIVVCVPTSDHEDSRSIFPLSISAISIRASLGKAEAVKFAESQAEVVRLYFGH